jgi:hypothetical protein
LSESIERPVSDFVKEAIRVADSAQQEGIVLRIMGACAIRIHCPGHIHLHDALQRELTDIDFVSYGKYNPKIPSLLIRLGYTADERILALYGERRHIYRDEVNTRTVDIFFDKLIMSHTIDYSGRLELDYPTVTPTDLLLQKVQIVRINEKDIKDSIILLLEHEVAEAEEETISARYIARLFSRDWGFYYTATTNLKKIGEFLQGYESLSDENKKTVEERIDKLVTQIEKEPKSMGWKMRAKVGTKSKWYEDVDDIKH